MAHAAGDSNTGAMLGNARQEAFPTVDKGTTAAITS